MRRNSGGSRGRWAAPVAVLVVALPLLGGCGIRGTDVIEAGGPATVEAFYNREDDMMLFFRAPDGAVRPVIRAVGPPVVFGEEYTAPRDPGPVPTEEVVTALLAGPGRPDRAAGLTTALPAPRPGGEVGVTLVAADRVVVRLPVALKGLDATAVDQLSCTIAFSRDPAGRFVVELEGRDGTSRSGTCPLASVDFTGSGTPGNAPTRSPDPAGTTPP
ncbi:hypothetical protein GTY66_24645 [Streptomyces sp. SID8356]|uniref:hypothetical protein n=1 Tax=unclassified Streptomyces TaxID=2593676 RepID=UPI0003A6A0F9|nr:MULTISPECIES: hypothetical protein [unclassified Streptomyces]MYT39196.1 hypothetical protein [Streptomyces sp. SID8356]